MTYPASPSHPRPARSATLSRGIETPWPLLAGLLISAGLCIGFASAARSADAAGQEVTFTSVEGADIGTAQLTATPAGLLIEVDMHDMQPETWHGFHIHETGTCDPADGFKSAGGHFAGDATAHGFMVDGGPHVGDMPNQFVSADGTLKAQVLNTQAVLGGPDDNMSGRALMFHGGPDDYESQPSGAAGDRVACAVID